MQSNVEQMMKFLVSLPLDTQYEQSLLANLSDQTELETILIAGDADASPCALLPMQEQLFESGENPGFPLIVEYADHFSVQVRNRNAETERYQTVQDFRRFCAHRFRELYRCTVQIPSELLRNRRLVYFQFAEDLSVLNDTARGCSGCVMVLAAEAGGLSESYMALCNWLKNERCIAGRVSTILNYRTPFGNRMLPFMAEELLGRTKLAAFRCGAAKGAMTTERALEAALLDIQERSAGDMTGGVLAACRASVEAKLLAETERQKVREEEAGHMAAKYQQARSTFRAMCVSEKYSLAAILTQEDMEIIRGEIRSMFVLLRDRFPKMVDEVVSKSQNPKADLKNLAGDYLSVLTDTFLESLMAEVCEKHLVPKTYQRFEDVCQRFRRMMRETELEYQEMEDHVEAEFLRMSDINIGDYHAPLAQVLSKLLTRAVSIFLTVALQDLGYLIASALERKLIQIFTVLADAAMPKKMFARNLRNYILEHLDDLEDQICRQLQDTVLPRLTAMLQEEFEKLTLLYDTQLMKKERAFAAEYEQACAQVQYLQEKLDQLKCAAE